MSVSPIYRIAVLADIHGNLQALDAVLDDLRKDMPLDGLLVAGDIIVGPGQQQVLQQLVELGAVMIQGNNEQRIARMEAGTILPYFYTARQFSLTRWAYEHLDPNQRTLVCNLPEQTVFQLPGADPIRIVHGSPRKVDELILPNRDVHPNLYYNPVMLDEIIDLVAEPVIIFGHTHLPWQAHLNGKYAFNPGAVNFPEDDYLGAQYAILEWDGLQWRPVFHRIPYDMEYLKRAYQESGLLNISPLAQVILQSVLTGRDYLPIYFKHIRKVASEFGPQSEHYYQDEVWDLAAATFAWENWPL